MFMLLGLVWLLSGFAMLLGLIRPSLVGVSTRRMALLWYGAPSFIALSVAAAILPHEPNQPAVSPTTAQSATKSQAKPALSGLGLSDRQVSSFPDSVFTISERAPLADGRDRRLLSTPDHLAVLELVGPSDNLSSASLSVFIPNDADMVVAKNTLLALVFLKNVFPDWEQRADWATSALRRVAESSDNEERIMRGDRVVRVHLLREIGMVTFTVSLASQ